MDYNNLCINCMREKPHNSRFCPFCGFSEDSYEYAPYVLQPRTPLNGKYILGRVLGAGGFGITYIALDTGLDRPVAIKEFYVQQSMYRQTSVATEVTISASSEGQKKVCEVNRIKFEQEAKTLARLTNIPGIVRVYEFFKENNTLYMALEYLPGMTLKDYVVRQGGRLSFEEVVRKLSSVMKSLDRLHNTALVSSTETKTSQPTQKSGIIHRDISPDNIMVSPEGTLTLFDFGGAKIQHEERSSVVLAKRGYTPIEQLQSDEEPGPWVDVYAMAATIYYCLCGNAPVEAAARVSSGDRLVRPSAQGVKITPRQEAVLLKGLAIQYKDRYRTMAEFRDALVDSLNPQSAGRVVSTSVSTSKSSSKMNPLVFAIPAAAVVLIGIGAFAVKTLTGNKKAEPANQESVLLETEKAEKKEPETKEPETKEPETKEPETKEPETKEPETKEPETKQPETKQPETKATEPAKELKPASEIAEDYNKGVLSYGEASAQMEDSDSPENGIAQLDRLKASKDAYTKGGECAASDPASALNWYGQVIEEDVNYAEAQDQITGIRTGQIQACQNDVNTMLAGNEYERAIARVDSALAVVPDSGELTTLRSQCVSQYSSYATACADERVQAGSRDEAIEILNEAYNATGDGTLLQKITEIRSIPTAPVINPDGSMTYNGHDYMIYDLNDFGIDDYYDMETFCENMGGHLAVISSGDENSAIYQYVGTQGLTMAFFGYSDEIQEGVWEWVTGESNSYTNWAEGQPNNGANNKKKNAENYAHFAKNGNGTWNDAPFGSNTSYFVCEWEWSSYSTSGAVPTPVVQGDSSFYLDGTVVVTGGYILPDSDKRYLSENELRQLTHRGVRFAINEIYARNGYTFTKIQEVKDYFNKQSWYNGGDTSDQAVIKSRMNEYEIYNVDLLVQVENNVWGGEYQF